MLIQTKAVSNISVSTDFEDDVLLAFDVVRTLQLWRWRQYVSPKHWYLPVSPHGITACKTNIIIFTTEETSDLTQWLILLKKIID
jgi:hypothetical protein